MISPPGRPGARRGHESMRDIKLRNKRSLDLYADLAGRPRIDMDIPPAPKPRAPRALDAGPPALLESDILKMIVAGLRMHPAVGLVERMNSGSAVERNSDGSQRVIQFHHIYKNDGGDMRAVDLSVTLRGGKRFVLEVKRPPWAKPRDTREREQAAYIAHVIACGGHGMFAISWDQVAAELARITGR